VGDQEEYAEGKISQIKEEGRRKKEEGRRKKEIMQEGKKEIRKKKQ
jgi:hypothetical protein